MKEALNWKEISEQKKQIGKKERTKERKILHRSATEPLADRKGG